MFTLSEFRLAGTKCPDGMMELFDLLGIAFPGWDRIDMNPQEWDRRITREVCAVMKSATISEGYAKLLNAGGISLRIGNPDDMLSSVMSHRSEIIDAVTKPERIFHAYTLSEKHLKGLRGLLDYLASEDDTKKDDTKKNPKLWAAISKLKSEVSNLPEKVYTVQENSLRPAKSLDDLRGELVAVKISSKPEVFTEGEALRVFAVLECLHAVKRSI